MELRLFLQKMVILIQIILVILFNFLEKNIHIKIKKKKIYKIRFFKNLLIIAIIFLI